MSAVGGLRDKCQSAEGLDKVIVRMRVEGGRRCIRKRKTAVSFLIVRGRGGMAIM